MWGDIAGLVGSSYHVGLKATTSNEFEGTGLQHIVPVRWPLLVVEHKVTIRADLNLLARDA